MVLGQIFAKNAKNDPKILFEASKSVKNTIRKITVKSQNDVKSACFWHVYVIYQPFLKRIGSERLIFRPDIWRQDPQLHWYAIGFNTARSAAMYVFANGLNWERNFNFVQSMRHSLDFEECSKPKFKSVGLHFMVPQIDKVWDGSAHSQNMVGGARGRVCNLKCRFIFKQSGNWKMYTHHINFDAFSYDAVKISWWFDVTPAVPSKNEPVAVAADPIRISTWNFVHIFVRHCPLTYVTFFENFDLGETVSKRKKWTFFETFSKCSKFWKSEMAILLHYYFYVISYNAIDRSLNPRPAGGGGGQRAPCGFSQIAPEVLGISFWNLPYLSEQQFHTLCRKIRTQVMIGQPWMTREWRHVSPILTNKMGLRESPPLVQF